MSSVCLSFTYELIGFKPRIMVEVGIAWQQPQGCGFGLSSMVK